MAARGATGLGFVNNGDSIPCCLQATDNQCQVTHRFSSRNIVGRQVVIIAAKDNSYLVHGTMDHALDSGQPVQLLPRRCP